MAFKYHKEAAKQGNHILIWGIFTLCFGLAFAILLYYWGFLLNDKFNTHWIIKGLASFIFIFVTLVAAVFIVIGLRLKRTKGNWVITVTDDKVVWKSPDQELDKSFELELSNIDRIQKVYVKNSHDSPSVNYSLITRTGTAFKLTENSGVNIEMFISELEKNGVQSEVINA